MWVAARERGNAVRLREHARAIRWRIFARKLIRFARALWRIRWRIFADIRIGARRTDPWDEPTACVVTDRNQWDDYEQEFEEEFDAEQEESGFSDTIERWGDFVFTDLMDAEGARG